MKGPDLSYRPLRGFEEFRACVEIQRETWGDGSDDLVPASLLSVAVKVGGVAAGAFVTDRAEAEPDPGQELVGFVFGLAGWREDRRVHWSHMLAVRRDHRNRGIGRRLKEYQRELLLEDGVEAAFWTYDPLVARNAHLNLNLLGARVDEFVVDMYGAGASSPLHVGGSTDRFVVRWDLESDRVRRALAGEPGPAPKIAGDAPTVDPREIDGGSPRPDDDLLRVAIPARAVAVETDDPAEGRAWRAGLRRTLLHYLPRGYAVTAFLPPRDRERGHYVLERA